MVKGLGLKFAGPEFDANLSLSIYKNCQSLLNLLGILDVFPGKAGSSSIKVKSWVNDDKIIIPVNFHIYSVY